MNQSGSIIDISEPQVMAILNVTPDSFYANSRTFTTVEIEERVRQILDEGASIIDIGGYSSRPGAEDVTVEEEWRRVKRGLDAVKSIDPHVALSIDTFRSQIVERAVEQYGDIIVNDISAGELDPHMIEVVAKNNLTYIAMHMRGTPQTMQGETQYEDIVSEVVEYFTMKLIQLKHLGINNIIIDPGFGFAKTLEQNYELLAGLNRLCELGYPVLSALSRKSMIYKLLNVDADASLTGTIALNWESLRQGASIIRVHDVREAVETVAIYKKLMTKK
ncbi:MAG: dihydropteroate synthase [Rikenellaceae bacterium]